MTERIDVAAARWWREFADHGVFTTDDRLVITSWNRWLERQSGLTADAVVGEPIASVIEGLASRSLDEYYRQALAGQSFLLSHLLHRTLLPLVPAGSSGPMLQRVRIAPLEIGGAIAGTITVIDDVTERVAAEQALRRQIDAEVTARGDAEEALRVKDAAYDALRRSEEQLHENRQLLESLTENASVALFIMDPRQHCIFMNPSAQALTGYTFDEVRGLPLHDLIHHTRPDGRAYPLAECPIDRAFVDGHQLKGEDVFVRRDGSFYDVSFTASPLRNGAGEAIGTIIEVQDISDRKRSEGALRASERRFRLMAQTVPSVIWTAAPEGRITYMNQQWLDFSGLTADQSVRGWPTLLVHDDDRERCLQEWDKAIRRGAECQFEARYRRHDGVYRWFVIKAVPLRADTGEIVSWFGVMTDIDDQKRAEERLREADRRKDEFLALLGHELRNPLAPVRTAVHLLRNTSEDVNTERLTRVMERQIDQMARLIDDLLNVSRITRGNIELRRSPTDLRGVIRQSVEACRAEFESGAIDLAVALPDADVIVDGDPVRLAQVVGNLLNNAAKFTNRGGHVLLTLERERGHAAISVRDDGIGIAAEHLDRIFEMFAQVDSSLERSRSGLGLGLTLVQRLVELHGGSVRVHSAGVGHGTEFVLRLPILVGEGTEPREPASTPDNRPAAAPRRVLVVDDNNDSAEMLRTLLDRCGHETRAAYDGVSALTMFEQFQPEVVLLDIGLPGLSGYEVARRIRLIPAGSAVKLVALTGWGQTSDRERSAQSGFDAHLVKPVDPTVLMQIVAEALPGTA